MATVISKTAAAIDAIENAEIISAHIDGSSHLILVRRDNALIDAGSISAIGTPTGSVTMFGGSQIPSGWLLCNGQAISRTTYANLFTAIGTAYGSGNGTTTFNVPNMETKFPRMQAASLGGTGGSAAHTHPITNHTHSISNHDHNLAGGTTEAHALVTLTGAAGIDATRVDTANWSAEITADLSNVHTPGSDRGAAAKVEGRTASGGTVSTASGGPTNSGTGDVPPYVNLNFIIKT